MPTRVVVLGAGFGGLELTTILSETFGDEVDVVLIDKSDTFMFGFSKLDLMFGREMPANARHPYRDILKPGVRFIQATVTSIDPVAKRIVAGGETYEADYLVVALGADIDPAATPGLVEGGNEFYSIAGAETLRDIIPGFERGHAVVGVTSTPFKCPPAPSECALLLNDFLVANGRRPNTEITLVMPFGVPIPPSPETSAALLAAFAERGITFVKDTLVTGLDAERKVVLLSDGGEMPYDLFLGIPKHRVPQVVEESGLMTADGWVPVDRATLETSFPDVFAIGDVNSVGTPKAGLFAEGAGKTVAAVITSRIRGSQAPDAYRGVGSCYLEFGGGEIGRVDVTFLATPQPTGVYLEPTEALMFEKGEFGSSRIKRWFGRDWKAKATT